MNKNMRICYLADKHELFDDRIYWKMAVPMRQRGFDVYYLLIGNENMNGTTAEGIHFEMLKVKTFSKNQYLNFAFKILNPFNNYKKLFQLSKKLKADIYHFHDLWINRLGNKLKKLQHRPVVIYDAREPYSEDIVSFSRARGIMKIGVRMFAYLVDEWEKRRSKKYDLIISNEEIVRDNFRKKLGMDKAEVIYNFTDLYNKYKTINVRDKKYDFIYCGGITESRGAIKIIEATCIVKNKFPDVKVVFIGKYSPQALKKNLNKLINKLNLTENIELKSFVDYHIVPDYYNESKVGLIPWLPVRALAIKMPIKIFEYMAFGLPIIGCDFGQIKKYIEQESCGITINSQDENEIASSMMRLLTDDKLYNLYSKNGRIATLEKFKWESEFNRLMGFYTRFLNEREING